MVGNDVWIGQDSLILTGVHIGDGAVIASRSVVSRDVPPYGVAGGNPARVRKKRFGEALIQILLELRWWDCPPEELVQLLPLLCDPDLERVEQALGAYCAARRK